jgi:hypothetical protein
MKMLRVYSCFALQQQLCLIIGLALSVTGASAAPQLSQSQVWGLNEDGYPGHFVYGLAVTSNNTILAACEGRVDVKQDASVHRDILLKRSTDGGATWGNDIIIEGASDTNSWQNPAFVVDGTTVFLFYVQSLNSQESSKVFWRKSTDNGLTWTARTEITSIWNGNSQGWTFHLPIGHGIKKVHAPVAGRRLITVWHRKGISFPLSQRNYGIDLLYFNNTNWVKLSDLPINYSRFPSENRIAERANGDLFVIARQVTGEVRERCRTASTDAGATWGASGWVTQGDIFGVPTDSGLLRFDDTYHLYSFPDNDSISTAVRNTLTIKASTDGGINWNAGKVLNNGTSTYSDLARDSSGNIYCIYGRDGSDAFGDRVYVAKFNMEWVLAP